MPLKIENLTKHFGGLAAVDNLSFEINDKEIVGLIGPNGAGKSTTINLITGVYRPDSGSVQLNGENLIGLKPNQVCSKGVVRTFQLEKPFLNLTVIDNVMIGALLRTDNVEEARQRAYDILKLLNITELASSLVKSLTAQNRKRAELARALATEPTLLLLDETMAGLNPTEIDEMLDLLRKLREEKGITLLIVEHVMRAIMSISDRIVVMDHGKKIAEGDPKEISTNQKVIESYLGKGYRHAQG